MEGAGAKERAASGGEDSEGAGDAVDAASVGTVASGDGGAAGRAGASAAGGGGAGVAWPLLLAIVIGGPVSCSAPAPVPVALAAPHASVGDAAADVTLLMRLGRVSAACRMAARERFFVLGLALTVAESPALENGTLAMFTADGGSTREGSANPARQLLGAQACSTLAVALVPEKLPEEER